MKASDLRKNFLKQFIIDFDTHLYSTQEERDWAYLAKRYILSQLDSTTMMSY